MKIHDIFPLDLQHKQQKAAKAAKAIKATKTANAFAYIHSAYK
jgi:hypothetical protein